MYAVIETGGKQYKVAVGDKLRVEKLDGESGAGITLSRVLLVGNGAEIKVGKPLLEGATVSATIEQQGRGAKIMIFKMRRRKHYRKSQGHRQHYTELTITDIKA